MSGTKHWNTRRIFWVQSSILINVEIETSIITEADIKLSPFISKNRAKLITLNMCSHMCDKEYPSEVYAQLY